MSFLDKIRGFLGLSEPRNKPNVYIPDRPESEPPDESNESFHTPFHNGPGRHFSIFSDPLEIHKYFEQQMDEMMKSFGFFGDGFTHFFNFPQIEDVPQEEDQMSPSPGDLRSQFLKPGFEKPTEHEERKDEDIDGKLDIRDWGSVFRGDNSTVPRRRTSFFGQKVTSRMITNHDGSIEIHRTVRDNQGNEETTITRKIGDKEYTVTKRRDKEGKEETIENFVNLDEKDVDNFFPKQRIPELDEESSSLFDRFFK